MTSSGGLGVFSVLEPLSRRQDVPEEETQTNQDIRPVGPEAGRVHPELEAAILRARGGGRPLEAALQEQMGARLGHDFSDVRIDIGPEADHLNRRLSANAFTIGSHIFFRYDAYDPTSIRGRELIAHELVHVVQQRHGRVYGQASGMTVRPANDALEQEADVLARQVTAARYDAGNQATDHRIRRQGDKEAKEGDERVAEEKRKQTACRQRPGNTHELGLVKPVMPTEKTGANGSPRRTALQIDKRPLVIQRTAAGLAANARNGERGWTRQYRPTTCNEAALGWLLKAEGYTHPWQLMRQIANTFAMPNSIATWLRAHIYRPPYRLTRANLTSAHAATKPRVGDILFTLTGANPNVWHSMVVVAVGPGTAVYIRGFNNAGTFNYIGIPHPAPPGAYDNRNRDVSGVNLWHGAGIAQTFGVGGGATLFFVRYQDAATRLGRALGLWKHSYRRTPGWVHNPRGAAVVCPASCPH